MRFERTKPEIYCVSFEIFVVIVTASWGRGSERVPLPLSDTSMADSSKSRVSQVRLPCVSLVIIRRCQPGS